MAQKFADILDICLERMFKGESVEECLNAYPNQAHELEPLLRTCLVLVQKSSDIKPAPELRARLRSRLHRALLARPEPGRTRIPIWRRRWAVALSSILIVFVAGIGMVSASAKAMPHEPLYPVKLVSEQAELALAFSDFNRAKLHIQFAQRRTIEMTEMALQGKGDEAFQLSEKATEHLYQLEKIIKRENMPEDKDTNMLAPAALSPSEEGTKQRTDHAATEAENEDALAKSLGENRNRNLDDLQSALEKAPEELKPYLEQAIDNVRADYDRTISILSNCSSP